MHQFLPDLYFTPRGNQPSDDEDDEEDGRSWHRRNFFNFN